MRSSAQNITPPLSPMPTGAAPSGCTLYSPDGQQGFNAGVESPSWQFILKEGFDYDHFANSAWLNPILTQGCEESTKVFKHILAACEIWITRLGGVSLPKMPDMEISAEVLASLNSRWLAAVDRIAYDECISYRNTLGEAYTRSFGDIARHVINHGTYHRGQIRQIFGHRGFDFPDTDFIGFSFLRDEGEP